MPPGQRLKYHIEKMIDPNEIQKYEALKNSKVDFISDQNVMDAVIAFKTVLQYTKDVFGDDAMTSDVIVKAIEAGSYALWRSIMGPKNAASNKDGNPFKDRWS